MTETETAEWVDATFFLPRDLAKRLDSDIHASGIMTWTMPGGENVAYRVRGSKMVVDHLRQRHTYDELVELPNDQAAYNLIVSFGDRVRARQIAFLLAIDLLETKLSLSRTIFRLTGDRSKVKEAAEKIVNHQRRFTGKT